MLSDRFDWRSGGPLKMLDIREEREEEAIEDSRWCSVIEWSSFSFSFPFSFENIEKNFIVR